jgi:hypothetical protein
LLKKILRGLFTIIGLILGYSIGRGMINSHYFQGSKYFNNGSVTVVLFLILTTVILELYYFNITVD